MLASAQLMLQSLLTPMFDLNVTTGRRPSASVVDTLQYILRNLRSRDRSNRMTARRLVEKLRTLAHSRDVSRLSWLFDLTEQISQTRDCVKHHSAMLKDIVSDLSRRQLDAVDGRCRSNRFC
jgi:hypothetical protein